MDKFALVVRVVQVAKVLFVSYDRRQFGVPPIMRCNTDSCFIELIAGSICDTIFAYGKITLRHDEEPERRFDGSASLVVKGRRHDAICKLQTLKAVSSHQLIPLVLSDSLFLFSDQRLL
jgi:hypothetical protein